MRYMALWLAIAIVAGTTAVGMTATCDEEAQAKDGRTRKRPDDQRGGDPDGRHRHGRRDRSGFPPRMRPGPFGPLTEEETEKVLAFMAEHLPELHERLQTLKEENPARFRAYMRRLRFEVRRLERLRRHDPEAFKGALAEKRLHLEVWHLVVRYRRAEDEPRREAIRDELEDVLERLFEAETVAREGEVRRLEERLKHVRERLKKRTANRDRIIEERLERLLSGERPESRPKRRHRPADAPPPSPDEEPPPPPEGNDG